MADVIARRVGLGLRAPRVAVLARADSGWQDCLGLIQALSQTWGGASFSIVPTDGNSVSNLFWKLLKVHDCDWFTSFPGVQISPSLEEELIHRHSVAVPWGSHIWPLTTVNVSYPLTSIVDALPDDPSTIPEINTLSIKADELTQTLIAASTGKLSDEVRLGLEEKGLSIGSSQVLIGEGHGIPWQLASKLWEPFGHRQPDLFPLAFTMLHLGLYVRSGVSLQQHALVAVCGNTFEDFALFWNLRCIRGLPTRSNVYWLPYVTNASDDESASAENVMPLLAGAIAATMQELYDRNTSLLVTSTSIPHEDLGEVGQRLYQANPIHIVTNWGNDEPGAEEQAVPVTTVPPSDERLIPYVAEFWEQENTPDVNRKIIQFLDGEALDFLETPVLTNVSLERVSQVRWFAEAQVEGLQVPTNPALTDTVVIPSGGGNHRVSRSGVAFSAVNDVLLAGSPIRSSIIRPRLKLPEDLEIISTLFRHEDLGITYSDKGQYEWETLRYFDGLQEFRREFNGAARPVFFKFIDDSPNQPDHHTDGVRLARKRRILDLQAITELLGGEGSTANAAQFIDAQLRRGLLQRGIFAKCPRCRQADWYSMSRVSDSVDCSRCGQPFVYPASSGIFFRLDEAVAEGLRHGSYLSLLVLDRLRRGSNVAFHFTTAQEVRRQEDTTPWLEVDFVAVVDGDLTIGEVKRGDRIDSEDRAQFNKYVGLCHQLHPKTLVLATGEPSWHESALNYFDGLSSQVEPAGTRLLLYNAVDYHWPGAG